MHEGHEVQASCPFMAKSNRPVLDFAVEAIEGDPEQGNQNEYEHTALGTNRAAGQPSRSLK